MLKISQVNYIRDLHNSGCRISEITRETGIDPKTIRKYISKDDFSEKPPIKTTHQSILDEHKQTIDAWLEEDKKGWYKQKHTAKRVYERFVDGCGYIGSYSVVQQYVKKMREHILPKASPELSWAPGAAQVEFGDAVTATLVKGYAEEESGLEGFVLGTNGAGHQHLIVPVGGMKNMEAETDFDETTDEYENYRTNRNLYMHGSAISDFALDVVPKTVDKILLKTSIKN